MGKKIRPNALRMGITEGWLSNWFPKKIAFRNFLEEDVLIRKAIKEKVGAAGIDRISIERVGNICKISIRVVRPGIVIGRGGKGVEDLVKTLENRLKKLNGKKGAEAISLNLNIEELKRSEISASSVAQNIAWDLEKRMPFRRTIKKYLDQIMQNRGVKGAKIMIAGRLGGSEIARTEHLERGSLPLQTLRADIDYGQETAFTTYGTIGVKVWIYKGEVFNGNSKIKA